MLERIRAFFNSISEPQDEAARVFAPGDPVLAASALMRHVIEADGVLRPEEDARYENVLRTTYGLDDDRLRRLIEEARDANNESVDLYRFTSVLKRTLSDNARIDFIELLWELVYADRENHEMEDNVVWRIAELLGVAARDRVMLRRRVRQKALGVNGEDDET